MSANQAQEAEVFRFLDLPPEIRNRIYRMNMPDAVVIASPYESAHRQLCVRASKEVQGTHFNMLLICKQVYLEASTQLYGSVPISTTPTSLVHMLQVLGREAAKIRQLIVLDMPLGGGSHAYREAAKSVGGMHLRKLVVKSADRIGSYELAVFLGAVLKATAKARDRKGLHVEPLSWAREMVKLEPMFEGSRQRLAELLEDCIRGHVEKEVEFRKAVIAMRKKHGTPVNGTEGRLWGTGSRQ